MPTDVSSELADASLEQDSDLMGGLGDESRSDYLALIDAIAYLQDWLFSHFPEPDSTAVLPTPTALSESALLSHPRLAYLYEQLALSAVECAILLLCAGVELVPTLAARCADFNGSSALSHVSPRLLIQVFGEAGVQVLDPNSTVRKWQLIALGPPPLSLSTVTLDRAILHFLMGHTYRDDLFLGRLRQIAPDEISPVPASYQAMMADVYQYWESSGAATSRQSSAIQLCRQDVETQQQLVHLLLPGMFLYQVSAATLPTVAEELHTFCERWERQARILSGVLMVDCHTVKVNDSGMLGAIAYVLETVPTPVVLLSAERLNLPVLPFTIEVPTLSVEEQKLLWRSYLAERLGATVSANEPKDQRANVALSGLVAQFNLTPSAIVVAGDHAIASLPATPTPTPEAVIGELWESCRRQSRTQLEGFATRVEPAVDWDDLVLEAKTADSLRQIISQVRKRATVYDLWQMGGRSRRGLGITAMFYGMSGTGKTTAAELIAKELRLDLYRIDLSAIVSKYIGETEKNLAKIFAAAEAAGAILQFDEADAIVGKRSNVKDSRDRYANMEVSYLLQRMEAYPGLAILTTNMPDALDSAFLRRIRFSIRFEFPDYKQRMLIWQKVYGDAVPQENLVVKRLAAVDMTGATIRNVAMGAAFLAAEEETGVTMALMKRSLLAECYKSNLNIPPNIDVWDVEPESA
ncbi:MAG: ATP-binding protein [Cyanobacteria bacterium J06560_2]